MADDVEMKFDPIDWQQMRILAKLTPGERMRVMAGISAFNRALLRGAFCRRYPDLPIEEINMKMLRYLEWLKDRDVERV
jgi:hypothetical protein